MAFDGTLLQSHEQTFTAKLDVASASCFRQANSDLAVSEEDLDILRIGQVLEDQVSDIGWKAHELKSRLSLINKKILRGLELLADYRKCFLASLGCEGKRFGHVQSIDLDYLRTIGLVDISTTRTSSEM